MDFISISLEVLPKQSPLYSINSSGDIVPSVCLVVFKIFDDLHD